MSETDPKKGPPIREDGAPWRNFYGRRHGKSLRKGQVRHLETTLARLAVPGVGWDENPARAPLDPTKLFGRTAPLVLEIGFGGGEHLFDLAAANPDRDFIGCEPFVNGVATLLPRVAEAGLTNIRIHPGDARDLLDVLPAASVARCYLLYPDPWPKKKHHRRRFVNPANLGPLARILVPGGELRIATDIPDYARHTIERMAAAPEFSWCAEGPKDWRQPWKGWKATRYEAKALREGRTPCYLRFRRA